MQNVALVGLLLQHNTPLYQSKRCQKLVTAKPVLACDFSLKDFKNI
jgi:hypothetical protein